MGIPFTGTHQEGTEHVEADKVNDGKLAAAVLGGLVGLIGRSFLARPIERAGQHDLLPGFTCCAPDKQTSGCAHRHARRGTRVEEHTCTYMDVCLPVTKVPVRTKKWGDGRTKKTQKVKSVGKAEIAL